MKMDKQQQQTIHQQHQQQFVEQRYYHSIKEQNRASGTKKMSSSPLSPNVSQSEEQINHQEPQDTTHQQPNSSSSPSTGAAEEFKPDTSKWRPANILTWGLTNSTRLIGWNDDDFRELLEEHRKRRKEDPSLPNAEETGFGLMNILVNTVKEAVYKKTDFDDLKSDLKKLEGKEDGKETKEAASSIDIIGTNVNVREMKAYKNLLSAAKYQRDAYIMGNDHAELRKTQREEEDERISKTTIDDEDDEEDEDDEFAEPKIRITYHDYLHKNPTVDSKSLGNNQLTNMCSWFIPSPTMHTALLPTALWTIAPPSPHVPEGGPLRRVIHRSSCALIPLSQNLLDRVMKSSILYVLSDQAMRDSVKGTSRNYLGGSVKGVQQSNGGKFVTTKTVLID
jgi:hypothetical protein